MRKEQKIVAVGAISGVTFMLAAMLLLTGAMPTPGTGAATGDKLAFAAKWIAFAALPLFLAIIAVGNARALSEAIDPTAGKESRTMIIDGRVVDNNVQQYLLFLAASLALAATAPGERLGLIPAASVTFVVARLAFWAGYRINPLYRAFGMAATIYLNLLLFLAAFWFSRR
jgi:hypothetical protein